MNIKAVTRSCYIFSSTTSTLQKHSLLYYSYPRPTFTSTRSVGKMSTTSLNNKSHNDDDNESTSLLPISFIKNEYPLIDVDCNLMHSDLSSLLLLLSSSSPTLTSSNYYEKSKSKYLNILHHPSIKLSNIKGMFTPSSTMEEGEILHNVLLSSDDISRNGIDIKMSIGIHPYHTNDNNINYNESCIRQQMKAMFEKDTKYKYITCIGETGLDYSNGFPEKEYQLPLFELQLNFAKEYKLPLFIHERLAFDDTITLIDKVFPKEQQEQQSDKPMIIIHCFTGKKEELEEYIRRGYYISLSGYILKSGDGPSEINDCLKEGLIPLDKLMIETDAPYMGFKQCRETFYDIESVMNKDFQSLKSKQKKSLIKGIYPNVPSALPKVLEHVTNMLNEGRNEREEDPLPIQYVAECLFDNSKRFFGFDL